MDNKNYSKKLCHLMMAVRLKFVMTGVYKCYCEN